MTWPFGMFLEIRQLEKMTRMPHTAMRRIVYFCILEARFNFGMRKYGIPYAEQK